ncbi:hypothetical protein PPYR_10912 [Photinus pyralis]|uniref:RPGRIP1 C-terminal domain-containing protein n=1 Tax=Photinus pyralis TaxID=7054 RepID=A0A5N4AHS0_PHOPY|nr:hypothetical protein PPYR_10912 [Photinus pyralis]
MSTSRSVSKSELSITYLRQTPTGNYVLAPITVVCPGTLSRYIQQRYSSRHAILKKNSGSKSSMRLSFPVEKIREQTHFSPVMIDKTQGMFEIRVDKLNLTQTAIDRIGRDFYFSPCTLTISWTLFDFEKTVVSVFNPSINENSVETSFFYTIDVCDGFLEHISQNDLILQLWASEGEKEVYLGSGEFSLIDVIDTPQKDLYTDVTFTDADKAALLRNTTIGVIYGTLSLSYRFVCDLSTLNDGSLLGWQQKRRTASIIGFHLPSVDSSAGSSSSFDPAVDPSENEIDNFQEALDLVLVRNRALKLTQSEIANELEERVRWLHDEANWKRTLQEHAILTGKDPNAVQWRQWRSSSSANVQLRDYETESVDYDLKVTILITRAKVFDFCGIFEKFFVRYSFLTHNVKSSHQSITRRDVLFKFEKVFPIHPKDNEADCHKLVKDIRNKEHFLISLIGEHTEDQFVKGHEIGTAKIALLDLVEMTSNMLCTELPLRDRETEVGYVALSITGILAMREVAIKLMAPPDFPIIDR